ncbi:hypothetical protein F2Q69_00043337 [Brassica cretica]|uniref:Uncharacterized protein n=1 Tax=Brassica cretica TaxID=69181 RepID=A0A8S9NEH0_BRACR|nr:hypothetical protein F2Q69_00043337 [Brassica cretica]
MARDRERGNAVQLAAAEKLGNQAASLEARLRVVSNERNSALEQVSFLEVTFESSANKFSDDLRRATYDAKKALADNYLDVLVSLKEKWEKKKAATDCEARLREVMANIDLLKEIMNNNLLASDDLSRLRTKEVELGSELDVMAVSDFSFEKLDLPQIMEDLPEDFFAKVPFAVNDTGDKMKCAGGQFEEGEFDIEDFAALVGGAGCNRRLDQGPGLQLNVKNIAIFGNRKFNELDLRGPRVLGGGSTLSAGFYTRASDDYVEEAEWEMEEVEAAYEWVEKKLVYRPPMKGWQSALKDGLLEAGVLPYNGFTLDHIYGTKIGVMLFDREGQKHSVVELLKYANSDTIVVYLYAYVHKILFTTKGRPKPKASGVIYQDADRVFHKAELVNKAMNEAHKINRVVLDNPMVGQGMGDNLMNIVVVPFPQPVGVSLLEVVGITKFDSFSEYCAGLSLSYNLTRRFFDGF